MIIGTIISTLTGIGTSFLQDFLHNRQDNAKAKLDIEMYEKKGQIDLALEKERQAAGLLIVKENTTQANINLQSNQENTKQQEIQRDISDNKTDETFIVQANNNIVTNTNNSKLIDFANFWISTTRSNITYIMLAQICFVLTYSLLMPEKFLALQQSYLTMVEFLFYTFDGISAYWFLRRSAEKRDQFKIQNPTLKKKL